MQKGLLLLLLISSFYGFSQQTVEDDFEGSGTINNWFGDDCGINTSFTNPFQNGDNNSATVLEYSDSGGQYANIRFDVSDNFNLSTNHTFSFKIYVSSSSLTGSQNNQVSLKLQDGTLAQPWSTQSEIIKTINLNQWQTVTFDFENDSYVNLDPNSAAPTTRTDFNRVLIQVNGENNNDHVVAYIDDFLYDGTIGSGTDPVFDNLIWSDEFNTDGALDASKWHHQTQLPNGTSWYNGEIQHYTNRLENSYIDNGVLYIVAKKETFTDQGQTKEYTSARLNSKVAFTYGRVEIKAKLPTGVGTWPALWMLGQNITEPGGYWEPTHGTTPWPACGEIDIMEHWGHNQNYVQSAMHTPSSHGGTVNLGGQTIPTASTAFHVYALEWTNEKMVFSVDDVEHYTYNPPVKDANTWPFDAPQYLLFNVAILPSIEASFVESSMEIDYIRVYQESPLSVDEESIAELDKVTVFPNPVANELKLKLTNELIGSKVTIYSLLGQKLNSFIVTKEVESKDLSNYKSGIYIVRIESKHGVKAFEILKK
ncbi:family 16 glycosylhydrolase [Pseudotenacibaculum sp. MALMAid0570]|uniref:family 16 glycosylhydrolase n=1 Tax=Pseudotenacibaculum sp. MALMAid0570 TaxID=3143938 RepID=UPI0032DF3F8F